MKVKAQWTYHAGKKYELKEDDIIFCCEDMSKSEAVSFGESDVGLNRNENVNISYCHPWPDDPDWDYEAIKFCPFCGTKIEIEINE
jgi:hypothetical protein